MNIAILGSGSWATALAKIALCNQESINWFIRRQEVIDEFIATGKNPTYLNNLKFDVARINFSADINKVIAASDVLILAIPSPYIKQSLKKIRRSLHKKIIVNAVKGMIPDENMLVTEYLHQEFKVPIANLGVIAGPCHAEEIVYERLSYLTVGCEDRATGQLISKLLDTDFVRATPSTDVIGLEYSSVMKNIYAIAAGMCEGLRYGDNFQAVLITNAVLEMEKFISAVNPAHRNVVASGYLGDVLVTSYSKFSRNRLFGQMIGQGYSVKAAQMEMQMVAEGFYGTKAIYLANQRFHVSLPIVDTMYKILYKHQSPKIGIQELTSKLY